MTLLFTSQMLIKLRVDIEHRPAANDSHCALVDTPSPAPAKPVKPALRILHTMIRSTGCNNLNRRCGVDTPSARK